MKRLLCLIPLLLATFAKADTRLPEVYKAFVADQFTILYHVDLSTTMASLEDLRFDFSERNEWGFPAVFIIDEEPTADTNPSTLETEWTDADGLLHHVRTPCRNRTAAGCAEWHRVQVRAMLAVFPKPGADTTR